MENQTSKNIFTPLSEAQVYCNGRAKISPSGAILEVMYTSKPVFNWGGFELRKSSDKKANYCLHSAVDGNPQSKLRARKRVFDLVACNEDVFDTFVTLTLDQTKVNRYDIDEIYWKKVRHYLDHRVQRKGLAYILAPELHKDGAIHFHGLMNSSALELKDSGQKCWKGFSRGKRIYNVADWKIGFTTAMKLTGDHMNVAKYITKYVTKQMEGGMIGGRYYYHGGALKEPHYKYFNFTEEPEGKAYDLEDAGLRVVYVTDLTNCNLEFPGL